MVGTEVQIVVRVSWFAVTLHIHRAVLFRRDPSIEEKNLTVFLFLLRELDVRVLIVDVRTCSTHLHTYYTNIYFAHFHKISWRITKHKLNLQFKLLQYCKRNLL